LIRTLARSWIQSRSRCLPLAGLISLAIELLTPDRCRQQLTIGCFFHERDGFVERSRKSSSPDLIRDVLAS
jgi:hypothetical protein